MTARYDKAEVARLAIRELHARQEYERLQLVNTAGMSQEALEDQAVAFALAKAEWNDAKVKLCMAELGARRPT